ncbi:TIGR03086 family protein [Gordonia sp. TBRC 11910]|uniref:TIGR03086 family protein n=1 Tax=Gordonia asplenii TaxID=2725283 RepID=A0A848KRP5_9ACTN|nr:TIGR03086 family metal-binding protein [Gordonia asplenii]NMO00932.1 TIGR03086 family protein [Gordonia asplenii]
MTAPTQLDPRPIYFAATAWVTELLHNVDAGQLGDPTPCTEFDVATLGSHLVATVGRAAVVGEGGDFSSMPVLAEGHDADAYAAAVERAAAAWADDSRLSAMVTVPWGEVPGAGALWGYINETLVHGWDLAVATGQPAEADPALVTPVLAAVKNFLPAHIRSSDEVPFGEVVTPRDDAGLTEQLANWSGRAPFTRA